MAKMDISEEAACLRFIEKYFNNCDGCFVAFHIKPLTDAINEACFTKQLSSRRILLLYFHSDSDTFSKDFCTYIKEDDVTNLINESFYLIAWDISSEDVHHILKEAVKKTFDIDIMSNLISEKKSAIFLVTTVSSVLNVFSFMHGSITKEHLMFTLQQVQKAVAEEYAVEQQLLDISQNSIHPENDINSTKFQQIMFDQLGDRDYDSFEYDEHEHLKNKIGFALFGPPKREIGLTEDDAKDTDDTENVNKEKQSKFRAVKNEFAKFKNKMDISRLASSKKGSDKSEEFSDINETKITHFNEGKEVKLIKDLYDDKEVKQIDHLYKKICSVSNEFSKWTDRIVISFLFNCVEPLPKVKLDRSKKYHDYNPSTDLRPVPVFVLRKCKGSSESCRVFIGHDARVYKTWKEYLEKNKLHKCKMIVPRDGRYDGDSFGNVMLDELFSPACQISVAVLQGADIASTTVGLASGGIVLAAMIPAIAVAPIALTVAGIAGAGVGLYSLVRGSFTLADRSAHQQTMSFADTDARGAYINIVAGSLGFFGAGATNLVSTLTDKGVNIGQGARMVVDSIQGVNIAAGGVGVANSAYEVIYQYLEKDQTPSHLTIIQLRASVLFFGNIVYDFRSDGTIDELQTKALKDIHDSLHSNKHRKTLNKLLKETVPNGDESQGRPQVIVTLRIMKKLDDVIAFLTGSDKNFQKEGIRFSTKNGEIILNGVTVDILNNGSIQQPAYYLELPPVPDIITDEQQIEISNKLLSKFNVTDQADIVAFGMCLITNKLHFQLLMNDLLSRFNTSLQEEIIDVSNKFIQTLVSGGINFVQIFKYISSQSEPLYVIMKFVVTFLQAKVNLTEQEYQEQTSCNTLMQSNADDEASCMNATVQKSFNFFSESLTKCSDNYELTMAELSEQFINWLSIQISRYLELDVKKEKRSRNQTEKRKKLACKVCDGRYYTKMKG